MAFPLPLRTVAGLSLPGSWASWLQASTSSTQEIKGLGSWEFCEGKHWAGLRTRERVRLLPQCPTLPGHLSLESTIPLGTDYGVQARGLALAARPGGQRSPASRPGTGPSVRAAGTPKPRGEKYTAKSARIAAPGRLSLLHSGLPGHTFRERDPWRRRPLGTSQKKVSRIMEMLELSWLSSEKVIKDS